MSPILTQNWEFGRSTSMFSGLTNTTKALGSWQLDVTRLRARVYNQSGAFDPATHSELYVPV